MDPGWKNVGSGMEKSDPGSGINIPDPQHCPQLQLFHFEAYPDLAFHFDTNPDLPFRFEADPDKTFQL